MSLYLFLLINKFDLIHPKTSMTDSFSGLRVTNNLYTEEVFKLPQHNSPVYFFHTESRT